MAKKPTVTTLQSGFNSTEVLNQNFEALRDAFDNTLSLDGSTPNAMEADLDLNGNNIIGATGLLINGTDYLADVEAAKAAALVAQSAAELAENNAETAEVNAEASETAAANSATAAASSASAASVSATASQTAQTAAELAETNAETAETNAETAETNAQASALAALASEIAAGTSETNAAASEAASSTSETNAAASATAASTSETNAATSETNAAISETNAANSATASASSATASAASATAAASSETAAAASEAAASTSETNAAASETAAAASETAAASSASSASTSASNAASSASSASASADAALAALDNFDDRYLGQKASDPTLDNDGDALVAGALYFNTTDEIMKVFDGSLWVAAYASLSGAMFGANNLSDVADAAGSRSNLGLGTGDSPTFAGLNTTGDVSFGDNDKAIFGAGSDLQIYHDGDNSYIDDAGTGQLLIRGRDAIVLEEIDSGDNYIYMQRNNKVELYYSGSPKLATTSTGIDVTGTVTADGLTVSGTATASRYNASGSAVQMYGYLESALSSGDGYKTVRSVHEQDGYNYSAQLFWRDDLKLKTTDSGVDVTGTVTATAFSGDGSSLTGITSVPAGAVIHVAQNTAPTGYLKANGATISRTTYADLFAAIGTTFGSGNGSTTFKVPDLRGEFIRGWDNGRGVDSGRALGTAQGALIANHKHLVASSTSGSVAYPNTTVTPSNQVSYGYSNGGYERYILTGVSGAANIGLSSNPTTNAGAETRPRNVALLACIKY